MEKEYKAVVVATDPKEGVLFAQRVDSKKEAMAILGEEIVRLTRDFESNVMVESYEDGYGESVISFKYSGTCELDYKVCFEKGD